MKKLYFYLVAAVMMIGATACQQDAVEGVKNEKPSFTATLNGTRTELGENNKVMWNADDKIAVYTQENTAGVVFDGDATEAAATAKFTTTEEFAASTTGYLAVYPELKWNTPTYPPTGVVPAAEYADGVWNVPVHIGVEQDVTADGWDEKYNYMVAYSEDTNLSFQAATALIKFTYTGMSGAPVTFTAEGANLAGDATMHYNTADGSISYTTTGTTTEISFFGCVAGETYFIPIFPGKVTSFAVSGLSVSYAPETYIGYDGEFEFKAGKIYKAAGSDEPVATPSPWTMMDHSMGTNVTMTIDDNGYHVAKAVPAGNFFFHAWDETNGEQNLTASKELAPNEWQATAEATSLESAFNIPMGNMFDVYLAPDASMFCVVEAGATVPEMPKPFVSEETLWAISGEVNGWSDTFMWTTETEGLLVAQNVTFENDYSEFKFRYNSAWEQQYTSEVYGIEANKWVVAASETSLGNTSVLAAGTYDVYLDTTNSKIYVVAAGAAIEEAVEQTVSNQKPVESAGKLYLVPNSNWKVDNARFAAYFFGNGERWLDMTDADGDGYYECEIPEGYPNVIFCRMNPSATANNWNNKWNQTADLTVPTDGTNCYTVKAGTWDKGGGTWSTYTK